MALSASVQSQCLPEGITFTTQEEIDSFQVNYPGCTEIEGDVTIGGFNNPTDITNLEGLSMVTSIGGSLLINSLMAGNQSLTSLEGLENLTSIGGDLVIENNETLSSLTGQICNL